MYSSHLHREETILKWAEDFQQNFRAVLTHCTQPGVGGYTPSDFSILHIEQSSLSRLEAKFPNLEDIYPLSPMQEGMLFHTVYSPEEGMYFEQVTGRISGLYDISAFHIAWQKVVERHPVLRSAFVWEGQKQAVQIVNKSIDFAIIPYDWRDLSPEEQDEELKRYLNEDRKQGFVLEQAPLMRFAMMRLDNSTWEWVWSHHHILLDGWSLPILFQEVLTIYESTLQGVSPSLPPVPPYRNYIQWLASRDSQLAQQFWRETLAGLDKPTRLLYSLRKDEEVEDNQPPYDKADLRLSEVEFASLQKMTQNHHLTLSTLAQGAWALLLQKYSAGQDVLFGVTVSGRPGELPDVEKMVGLFINTLPLRVRFNPTQTVADWLQEIQQHHIQMREYEYGKLTDIHQAIAFPTGEPLFESILVFENYPIDQSLKTQRQHLKIDDIQFYERTNYPLTIAFIPDNRLLLRLNYETSFLSSKNATILLQELRSILLKLAHHPEILLGNLQLSSAAERQLAIETWNNNFKDWGEFHCTHQLFEDQVDTHFNNIAVVCGEDALTYGELETKANQLAAILKTEGVGYEDIIGLYFEPSLNYLVALLATLKAGAAFLPIDPNYPKERIKFILQDSQARLILAQETSELPELQFETRVMGLSQIDWSKSAKRLNLKTTPSHIAYVIYTSGSTGKPKGVLVTHQGIQNLVRAQTSTFGVTPESKVYQFASLSFDAAISEIFMALGSGASLYLRLKDHVPGAGLWESLSRWKITHITLPPSLLAVIKPEELPYIQSLIVAGEAASLSLLQRWNTPGRKVFNAYGPTEATVCASMMDCSHLTNEPSIGRAITNGAIYLLDSNLEPVIPGVPGEIYIGGVGLARGYFHQPGLTAGAFIPHPFAKESGARLYRTGDIGVCDRQGNITFIGREDNRVKYHGHRIELGEIEAALTQHPSVDSAVVLLREDTPGRQRLVGYVLKGEVTPTPRELLEYLSQELPLYMVPNVVVIVEEWSLTPNGKIDRKALPVPELPTSQSGEAANEIEEILCQVWAEVLGLETVHPEDNFFEIGGDSIISLQIVSRAREAGLDIHPKDIFEAQTLYRLAAVAKPFSKPIEIIEPLTGTVPLSPVQHWFFEQNLVMSNQWNQAIAINVHESLDIDALEVALEAVVTHHDALRLGFENKQGIWEQFYSGPASKPSLCIKNFSNYPYYLQPYALQLAVEKEHTGFHLENPPLLRVLYAKNLEEYGNVLYLFGHHLVFDGVSWRILMEDLTHAYHQAIEKKPISLPLKTSSYRQWTTSLKTIAQSQEIEKDIPYWLEIVSTSNQTLPLDIVNIQPSTVNTVENVAIESVKMSSTETLALLQEATVTYHALIQEILLSALLKTLTDWNNSSQILIDLEGHGRENLDNELDVSRTVGWFTSIYPVLLKNPKSPDTLWHISTLKEIKKQMRSIPHYGISYSLLRYLNHDTTVRQKLANTQKAQISFNYLGQIDNQQKNNNHFTLSNAPTGLGLFPQQQRPYLLAVNARVQSECLHVDWSYCQHIHHSETIHHLAENYLNNLRSYLHLSSEHQDSFYVSSDFSLVDLSESELDSILEDLEDKSF
ncbi:MAG: amino acid adenylation domain-containing protein [Scytonema sp. PMC 1069.18]|nr:amino acid adenylation domain-containing protein [Scytonema sp. PMC 1069.18]